MEQSLLSKLPELLYGGVAPMEKNRVMGLIPRSVSCLHPSRYSTFFTRHSINNVCTGNVDSLRRLPKPYTCVTINMINEINYLWPNSNKDDRLSFYKR